MGDSEDRAQNRWEESFLAHSPLHPFARSSVGSPVLVWLSLELLSERSNFVMQLL